MNLGSIRGKNSPVDLTEAGDVETDYLKALATYVAQEMRRGDDSIPVHVTRIGDNARSGTLPQQMRAGDAASDLSAAESAVVPGRGRATIGTGIAVAIEPGCCGLVLPRSGLAAKFGLTLVNSPGLIDSGYRGELKVIMLNTSESDYKVDVGDRIAQLLIMATNQIKYIEVDDLPAGVDDRGTSGFGSSGLQ